MGTRNTKSGLTAISNKPASTVVTGQCVMRPSEGGDMASRGETRVARQAGRTDAANAPPNAHIPERTTHQKPNDAPLMNSSGFMYES